MEQSDLDLAFAREHWEATGHVSNCPEAVANVCFSWFRVVAGSRTPLEDGSNTARALQWRAA